MIYFDNAASTKPRQEAIDVFTSVVSENYSNPSALHKGGIEAEKLITAAKENILKHLPCGGTLIFTSGATESNNIAIMNSVKPRGKMRITIDPVSHPSVRNVENVEFGVTGEVDENTALVSINAVCGETGYIADTKSIYSDVKGRFPDCIVHIDGAQGFLKVPMYGDLISLSSHKIGGISGVGALYIKDGIRIKPMMFGGGQQKGIRPGTEPAALITAFAEAAYHSPNSVMRTQELCERLIKGLKRLNLQINRREPAVPDIINFSCGVKSEVMLHFLAESGIYVSSGSACARGKKSQILPAYGVSAQDIDTAIRVSLGWQNTVEEVDQFLNILEKGLKRWKK